jgi:capsular polysaccharide transport system permease protein
MTISSATPARSVRFQWLRVLLALMVREMGAKFGRSAGGYFWAIAEPLGGIVMLALAFSVALRSPPIGTSFMFFYATGIIPFTLYKNVERAASRAVNSNRGLLTYPVVTPLDAVLANFILGTLTMMVVGAILCTAIILVQDVHVNFDPARVLLAMGMAAVLGLGIGTLNCVLIGFFPTWKNIWSMVTRPMFLVSGIFYTYDSVPAAFQSVLWYNPLVHVVGMMRSGFYGVYRDEYVSVPYVLGIALGTFVIGAWLLRRHASHLIEQ